MCMALCVCVCVCVCVYIEEKIVSENQNTAMKIKFSLSFHGFYEFFGIINYLFAIFLN